MSRTDSSNASISTPMEIGDIQVVMQQEAAHLGKRGRQIEYV